MAHFVFFTGYTDPIPDGHVPDSVEYTLLWKQVYAAINGDGGGTWSPSAFITVGGSGFQLTGVNHSLAASARLNVESTGEVRLKAGALLKADGTSGDIRLEVTGGVATLTIQANALGVLAENADFDAYGAITLKDNGGAAGSGGNLIVEDTGLITVQSGGLVAIADGATFTLNGDQNISSTGVVTYQNGSNLTSGATAFAQWSGEWWFAKTVKVTSAGDFIIQGSTNWIQYETARPWSSPGRILLPLTFAGGSTSGPADPDAWVEKSDLSAAPCFRTSSVATAGGISVIEFVDLPTGGEITEVTVTTKGTDSGSIASTRPQYQIVSWEDSAAAGNTTHSLLTTDAGSIATFGLTVTQTTIAATGSPKITAGRHYGLRVIHPYEAINNQGVRIYECTITGTAEEHQI